VSLIIGKRNLAERVTLTYAGFVNHQRGIVNNRIVISIVLSVTYAKFVDKLWPKTAAESAFFHSAKCENISYLVQPVFRAFVGHCIARQTSAPERIMENSNRRLSEKASNSFSKVLKGRRGRFEHGTLATNTLPTNPRRSLRQQDSRLSTANDQ
jgi:hypothetical protein